MRIKKNGRIIRISESDLKRIVKRVLTEDAPNKGQEHKKEIEDFLSCPTNQKFKDRMRKRLQNDAYSKQTKIDTNIGKGTKGEVNIKFNGREMSVEDFIDEAIDDYEARLEDGKEKACKEVTKFFYKNRALGKTTIDIETNGHKECDCKEKPKKEEPKKKVKPETGSGGKQETDCRKPDYFRNTLDYYFEHTKSGRYDDFWETVTPKMGYQKPMCACFKQHRGLDSEETKLLDYLCQTTGKDVPLPKDPKDDDDWHSLLDDLRDRIGF